MHMELQDEEGSKAFPQKITVDLARACLATGDETNAQEILGRIAAENHENRNMIAHIESTFSKTGKEEAGQALLAKVGREVVEINKLGDMEAAGVDREVSLGKLLEAANAFPACNSCSMPAMLSLPSSTRKAGTRNWLRRRCTA